MRSFTAIMASASLLATTSLAASSSSASGPGDNWSGNWGNWTQSVNTQGHSGACLSDKDAQTVADNFGLLLTNYSEGLANATLTSDFHDYTDSVAELINNACAKGPATLGAATFDSRASFEKGQGTQPAIPFQLLQVWHDCDSVTIRWVSEQSPSQVVGIAVLESVYQNKKWLIQNVYSEFNSGAWLVNLGLFKPTHCDATHHG